MKCVPVFVLLLILFPPYTNSAPGGAATKIHVVVPATQNNVIVFEVANMLDRPLDDVTVAVTTKPSWVIITAPINGTSRLMEDSTTEISVFFNVAATVDAGREDSIVATILSGEQIVARRAIHMIVAQPQEYSLSQNYPNPFNPTTSINLAVPCQSNVRLTVYNMLGQAVATLVDGFRHAGFETVEWDGTNNSGASVGSGVYFLRFEAVPVTSSRAPGNSAFTSSKKMILLK